MGQTHPGGTIRLTITIAACLLLLIAGCKSMNTGTFPPVLGPGNVSINAPAGLLIGTDATWSASWTDGYAPYTYTWDFGGGAEPNTATGTTEGLTCTVTVEMLGEAITGPDYFAAICTVTDSLGRVGSSSLNYYTVYGPNQSPVIQSAVYTEEPHTLEVIVTSPDDKETFTVDVSIPKGLIVDAASKVPSQTGPVTVTFLWSADDILNGGSGTTTVTVTDQDGGAAQTYVDITVPPISLADDTIYAIPAQETATQLDNVTIVVATGVPAHPFQYLVGANVTMPDWCTYAANSYNIGSVGGSNTDADGIWGVDGMGMGNGSFLTGPDTFFYGQEKTEIGIDGRHRLELTVVPLGGSDITGVSGALCNFKVDFRQTGTATFGFIESQPPIDRTYYRDGANNDYYWGTLAAGPDGVNTTDVNNTVVVE